MNPVCWSIYRRLGAYQDGELGPAARAKVEAHVARCARCAAERAELDRVRAALAAPVPEPPEAVWQAFWPQLRTRLATAPTPEPRPAWREVWETVVGRRRRLAIGSALAAAALATLAVLAPWERIAGRQGPAGPNVASAPPMVSAPIEPASSIVVQSVETADPQSSVMVFTNPDSDVTVVWVFGLEPTDI